MSPLPHLYTGLRSSRKNEKAAELSVFVSMAPELCFFMTWLRFHSGYALLTRFNNFGIPSILLVASERVIPTYFELILNTAWPAYWEGVCSRAGLLKLRVATPFGVEI